MARLLILSLGLFAILSAFPMKGEPCTYEKAVGFINRVLGSPFAQYIPENVLAEMKDIIQPQNQAELQNLVDLHNKMMAGQLTDLPKTQEEGIKFLEQNAPLTYPRVQRLFQNYKDKVAKLSDQAKKFLQDQQKAFEQLHSDQSGTDVQAKIVNQIHTILAQDAAYQALPASVKQEFRTQWPSIMKFCDSPIYTMMISILKGANNSNLPQTVASLMTLWGYDPSTATPVIAA